MYSQCKKKLLILQQIRGDSVNFYRLLYRLVAQKPLKFFQDHIGWSKSPDEQFAPKNGETCKNGVKTLTEPIKIKDEGTTFIVRVFCHFFKHFKT